MVGIKTNKQPNSQIVQRQFQCNVQNNQLPLIKGALWNAQFNGNTILSALRILNAYQKYLEKISSHSITLLVHSSKICQPWQDPLCILQTI